MNDSITCNRSIETKHNKDIYSMYGYFKYEQNQRFIKNHCHTYVLH